VGRGERLYRRRWDSVGRVVGGGGSLSYDDLSYRVRRVMALLVPIIRKWNLPSRETLETIPPRCYGSTPNHEKQRREPGARMTKNDNQGRGHSPTTGGRSRIEKRKRQRLEDKPASPRQVVVQGRTISLPGLRYLDDANEG
jgi:hypothetical protein